jgi:tetratricopeptide (TPR) repeat protein
MTAKTSRTLIATGLAALLLVPFAEAKPPKKPRKPNQNQQQQNQQQAPAKPESAPAPVSQTPPPGLDVEGKLGRFQTGEARSTVQRFADQAGSNAYVAMAMGRVLEQEKKYGEAEGQLRKATELAANDPAPFVYLGEVYLRQRNDGAANEAFRKAADLARAKSGSDSAYYLGVAQQRLRQYDEAISTFQGARAPEPALIPYQIGVTQAFKENWAAAAEQLGKAIEMDSGLAYAYYYRGLAQEKMGRKDLLVNDMERFLAIAPNAPEADRAKAILRAVKR